MVLPDKFVPRIILSLDNLTPVKACSIIEETKHLVWGYKFKITDLLFVYGIAILQVVKDSGRSIMVDPKLFDTPDAMKVAVVKLLDVGVDIVTVHMSALYLDNPEVVKHLAGVTILTTVTAEECEIMYHVSIRDTITYLADMAVQFKYGYVVCSADELDLMPLHKITTIVPGIRPAWYQREDDQKRVSTPHAAIEAGADLLVMGRPILNDPDPVLALKKTNDEIDCTIDAMSSREVENERLL